VSRRAVDDRIVIRDAGLLRRLRDVVDVGAERENIQLWWGCWQVLLNREAVLAQDAG
jgi:hypothetical protein